MRYQQIVNSISVSREAATYATDLIRATRPVDENQYEDVRTCVDWGAGPRAGQALIRIAKAMAAMEGRPGISTSDIREAALPVLRHRICFNYRGRTKFQTEDNLIEWLLGAVKPE